MKAAWSARPVAMVTVPPRETASIAFLSRLSRICSTIAGSQVATTGAPPFTRSCARTPASANDGSRKRVMRKAISLRSCCSTSGVGQAPRLSPARTIPATRSTCASRSRTRSTPRRSCWDSKSSRSSCRWPLTVLSGVPISWANIAAVSCIRASRSRPRARSSSVSSIARAALSRSRAASASRIRL